MSPAPGSLHCRFTRPWPRGSGRQAERAGLAWVAAGGGRGGSRQGAGDPRGDNHRWLRVRPQCPRCSCLTGGEAGFHPESDSVERAAVNPAPHVEGRGGKANGPVAWAPRLHPPPRASFRPARSQLAYSPPEGESGSALPTPSSPPARVLSAQPRLTEHRAGHDGHCCLGDRGQRTCRDRAQKGTMTKRLHTRNKPAG